MATTTRAWSRRRSNGRADPPAGRGVPPAPGPQPARGRHDRAAGPRSWPTCWSRAAHGCSRTITPATSRAPRWPASAATWRPGRSSCRASRSRTGPISALPPSAGPEDLIGELVGPPAARGGLVQPPAPGRAARAPGRPAGAEMLAGPRRVRRPAGGDVRGADARGVAPPASDGINLWVEVADEQASAYRLATSGVGVAVGSPFVPTRLARDHIRITAGWSAAMSRRWPTSWPGSAAPPSPQVRGW